METSFAMLRTRFPMLFSGSGALRKARLSASTFALLLAGAAPVIATAEESVPARPRTEIEKEISRVASEIAAFASNPDRRDAAAASNGILARARTALAAGRP